jgi:membrane associated rhomboid family serine protease
MIPLHDSVPTRRRPVLTIALILVNIAVFLWSQNAATQILPSNRGPVRVNGFTAVTAEYGFVPCELTMRCAAGDDTVDVGRFTDGTPAVVRVHHVPVALTLLTSIFMHGGWEHLLGNMLFLWIFGNNIEDRVGRRRFLIFYLLGGLAAAALQLAAGPSSAVPNIGASGAIAAVLGGYLLLYPTAAVVTYIPPFFFIPLPAVFFLVGWFLLQIVAASSVQVGSAGGGVAYFAHIGGFVCGMLLVFVLGGRRQPPRPVTKYDWPV